MDLFNEDAASNASLLWDRSRNGQYKPGDLIIFPREIGISPRIVRSVSGSQIDTFVVAFKPHIHTMPNSTPLSLFVNALIVGEIPFIESDEESPTGRKHFLFNIGHGRVYYAAGCRSFRSLAQAEKHWTKLAERGIRRKYQSVGATWKLRTARKLFAEAARRGWIKAPRKPVAKKAVKRLRKVTR